MLVQHILPQATSRPPVATGPGRDALRIALVNNLPDAALGATERQFGTLLGHASAGLTIKLDLYTLPGVARGREAQAHLHAYYEDLAELERRKPDGIIVTGTEPHQARLQEEAFWPAFTRLFDFARQSATPVIWCCLAAHAAVLYGDGIERTRLPNKLSGLFDSHVVPGAHDLLRGLPRSWRIPQSRFHGLSERVLIDRGYEIGSRSRRTGPDVFFSRESGCHMFMQAHPEYGAASLVAEYRRDVRRFLHGEQACFPAPPRKVFPRHILRRLSRFAADAERARNVGQIAALDTILAGFSLRENWAAAACKLYSNWVTHLSEVACQVPTLDGWHPPTHGLAPAHALAKAQAAD